MVYDSMISLGREEEYMRVNGRPNVLTEVAQRIATVLGGVLAELEQEVVMLEIPESRTIAAQMNETIQGKRILEAEAAHTPHSFAWYSGEPAFYAEIMEGREIGRAESLGSMIEMRLGDYSFVVGDGTNARYFAPGEKLPEKYQIRITLEDDSHVVCTVQMYGAMFLVQPDVYDNPYYLAGKRKPMPNTEDFTYGYFKQLFDGLSGNTSMKAFLATEQRIPGLGNGVLQDILLAAGLHPKRKISGMTEERRRKIYDAVQGTLERMTAAGGMDTEKDFFGRKGGCQTFLSKKTVGKPCPYCGNPIQKMNYLGGTVYFCPFCQN